MTKKSANRVMRDVTKKQNEDYFQKNTVFDELNDIHGKIIEQIQAFGNIGVLANNKELCSFLNQSSNIDQKVKLLAIDLQKVINDLNTNYNLHKDETGGAKDPDTHMRALTIFQNYMQITSVIEGVIFPTAATILEEFGAAEIQMNAAKEKQVEEQMSEPTSEPIESLTVREKVE